MDRAKALRYLLAALLIVFIIGTAAYWLSYFLIGGVQVSTEPWYTKFEDAFPVADAWASLVSVLAAYFLLRNDTRHAPFFLAASGASVLFLALMDITFNLENGLYQLAATNSAMQTEVVINAFTVVLGVFAMAFGLWMLRERRKGE